MWKDKWVETQSALVSSDKQKGASSVGTWAGGTEGKISNRVALA